MKIKINIAKAEVYKKVEGLSVIVKDRLPADSPYTWEQIWASASDGMKLDLFLMPAWTELKVELRKYIDCGIPVAEPRETELMMILDTGPWFRQVMAEAMKDTIEDYLVKGVTARWLDGFGLEISKTFADEAAGLLAGIKTILISKALQDLASERHDGDSSSEAQLPNTGAEARREDDARVRVRHDCFDLSGTGFGMTSETLKHIRRHGRKENSADL